MDIERIIGVAILVLWALVRYRSEPPPAPDTPYGWRRLAETTKAALRNIGGGAASAPDLVHSPPPRSNTTIVKYVLYSAVYAISIVLFYLAIMQFPGVAEGVQAFIDLVNKNTIDWGLLSDSNPIVVAAVVSLVVLNLPPIKGADEGYRRALYNRAFISAQRHRERSRILGADFVPDPDVLEALGNELRDEGFDSDDIQFDPDRTTVQSLWTKAAVLIRHIREWQQSTTYVGTLSSLRAKVTEEDGRRIRSDDKVIDEFEALKEQAKDCFQAMRESPGDSTTQEKEIDFRRACKALLTDIYDLVSRVSLCKDIHDEGRIQRMETIGIFLDQDGAGPIPDSNELAALFVIVGMVVFVPLTLLLGPLKGFWITIIVFSVILVPVIFAHEAPQFARAASGSGPRLRFPIASGALAMLFSCIVIVVAMSGFDLMRGWTNYTTRVWPFSLIHGTWAVLIAFRMFAGRHPDTRGLKGYRRYMHVGNPTDAAIFGLVTLALMVPVNFLLTHIRSGDEFVVGWTLWVLPPLIAFVIGFIVPTWYRANVLRSEGAEHIYRWDGSYFGFIRNDFLFSAHCHYVGWVDDQNNMWMEDGSYLGQRVTGGFVQRRVDDVTPSHDNPPKSPPAPLLLPRPRDKSVRSAAEGWIDPLDADAVTAIANG